MKQLRILQVAPPWIDIPPKNYGGTEWVISSLTEGLVDFGHDVTLFATKNSQTNAKLDYLFEQSLRDQNIPWEAALPAVIHYDLATKNAENFDIIHFHLSSQSDIAMFPYIAKLKVPHIVTIHGHWPYDVFSHMDKIFLEYYGSKLRIVNISKYMNNNLHHNFKTCGYVHNPIDISKYQFNQHPSDYFTWIGRIIPDKGLHLAIKAALETNNKLIFAGVYNQDNSQENDYFEAEIKPYIDNKQIIFLGPANLEAKNELLKNAIAFLNPIEWEEPFGMVIIESMACGTPVISYNRGAVSEIIIDNQTGYLVEEFESIKDKMQNAAMLDRQTIRNHVKVNFSQEKCTKKYENIYIKQINEFYSS